MIGASPLMAALPVTRSQVMSRMRGHTAPPAKTPMISRSLHYVLQCDHPDWLLQVARATRQTHGAPVDVQVAHLRDAHDHAHENGPGQDSDARDPHKALAISLCSNTLVCIRARGAWHDEAGPEGSWPITWNPAMFQPLEEHSRRAPWG